MKTLLLSALALLAAACAPADPCPMNVELDGDELPCDCQGDEVEALPGDGSICFCEDEGFTCYDP